MLIWKGTAKANVHSVAESSRRLGIVSVIINPAVQTNMEKTGWFCWQQFTVLTVDKQSKQNYSCTVILEYYSISTGFSSNPMGR
jgi:hypothetical protein